MGSLKNIYHVVIMIPRLIRFSVAVIEQAFKDFRGVGFFAYRVRKHEQVVTLSLSRWRVGLIRGYWGRCSHRVA